MTTPSVQISSGVSSGRLPRGWWTYSVLTIPVVVYLVALGSSNSFALFWAVGIGVGFAIQRSRLCFVSGFRDLFLLHQGRTLRGIILGLAVGSIGFAMIMGSIVADPASGRLPQDAHVLPLGIATVTGGFLFGVGMVLAGGCVTGSLYRMGEGYLGSWVAMGGVMAGLYTLNRTWNWWWDHSIAVSPRVWLPTHLGYTVSLVVTFALLALAYVGTLWWERRERFVANVPIRRAQPAAPASVTGDVSAALRRVFRREWTPVAGAVTLSLLNVLLFIRYQPLGVAGEISRWANDVGARIGQPVGLLKGLDTLAAACVPRTGDASTWFTNGFMLNAGIVVGSFTAAVLAREFRIRAPRQPRRYVQSLVGGAVMGYGAGLGLGCTLGAFYSAIPSLALNGWVYALALAGGAFLGSRVIRRLA